MLQHQIGEYSGPLNYLLELIEAESVPITDVSLVAITDDFVTYAQTHDIDAAESADWLLLASKLLYLKALNLTNQAIPETELLSAEDLIQQLKILKLFKTREKNILNLWQSQLHPTSLSAGLKLKPEFKAKKLSNADTVIWRQCLKRIALRLIKNKPKPMNLVQSLVSIQSVMTKLLARLSLKPDQRLVFHELYQDRSRPEVVALFLAMLELLKQRNISVSQDGICSHILITNRIS